MKTTSLPNTAIIPGNFRPLRRLCGLAIAAIGLGAPLASAQTTIPVLNGNFETEYGTNTDKTTNWVKLTGWTLENTTTGSLPTAGAFSSDPDGGSRFTRFTWNDAGAEQDLKTTVSIGDTLAVTFNFGISNNAWGGSDNTGVAYFKIGSQYYYQDCVVSGQAKGTWKSFTFTTTATNAGALILGFRVARTTTNNQYASLDGVSDVTLTPAANDPNMPTSTGATLAALENTATALATSNFGYADPNSSPLANVQITSLPALGTLKLSGTAVVSGDLPLTVAAANIGNLTYLSPLGGFGNAYTTMLIKVQNSANLWSLPATMTVNVTHVNHPPTTTTGAVTMSVRAATSMTFAASNFQFSDVDAGDTLTAIKVTSLPTNGALNVALDTELPVADIGTLTYTPTPGYTGPDSFDFQVSDGALFSANATMAISVTTDILVQDGSFETPGAVNNVNPFSWAGVAAPWTHSGGIWGQVKRAATTLPDNGGGTWVANFIDAGIVITQPLGSYSFNAGDTLTVTFDVGRLSGNSGGVFDALFLINGVELLPQSFNNTAQAVNTWATDTLTATIPSAVTGELTLKFRWVSGRVGDLDKVSNVSVGHLGVDPNAPTSNGATLAALENTATPLAAGDFGYANTANPASLLAAVQIIELPALGTLKNGGATVLSGDLPLTVAAADIGNLSYLSPLGGFGTAYTTIGIKVQNSDTPTGLWSLPATMTVNVTDVNHAPTSTGGAVLMSLVAGPSQAFAAGDFQFSDVDAGDTLHAIKVTGLPANGTLTYGSATVLISELPLNVPVATIGTLTYTPNTGTVADSFEFKVNDGALDSVTAATMAITVTTDIPVINGGFENPTPHNPNNGTNADWTAGGWAFLPAPWTSSYGLNYSRKSSAAMVGTAQPGPWICNFNGSGIWIKQDLGSSVNEGDTLSVTFQLMSDTLPGEVTAEFQVGTGPTVYSQTFTSPMDNGTWVTYTLTKTVGAGVSGNLVLKFSNTGVKDVNDRSWLDHVSNVSVTTGGGPTPGSFADWAVTNSPSQSPSEDYNKDGVQNGIAYFMGVTGPATNPGLNPGTNTVTWPMSATFQGTYVVETSTDLGTWTPAVSQPSRNGDGNLVFTLPPGAPGGKSFVRLVVTPN